MAEYLQQNIMWLILAGISGGMLIASFLRAGGKRISVNEATLLINREDAVVVDVRETNEWNSGHVPNARHLAMAQLDKRLSELDKFKSRPIIVYCASGARSANACGTLAKAGYEKVFNLAGGLDAWRSAGLPVTTKG